MGSMTEIIGFDSPGDFFAPVSSDLIDGLVGQYRAMYARIDQVADIMSGEIAGAVSYFFDGNGRDSRYGSPSVVKIFEKTGAVAALNAAYWSKAMLLTDVLNYMPQARRDEWNTSIRDMTCPAFEEETVRSTMMSLLNMRSQFLAERVDGIFRGLSGEHVTNSPSGFGKRMIVGYVLNDYCGYESNSKCGLINDLRCVIAKFMCRDEPGYRSSEGLINALKERWGEWVPVDGGALKIRLYKKGTAHIEVHPDMAWRLNATLAHLYPLAIPPEFRQKPARKLKEFEMIQRPLPFSVIEVLASMKPATRIVKQEGNWNHPYRYEKVDNAVQFERHEQGRYVSAEVASVLQAIGGVWSDEGWWQFDYGPKDVICEIVASGCIPDKKAHQFYPTPEAVAKAAIELAEISDSDTCLEPEAGTGCLAELMPKDRTQCIEISELHCKILKSKGLDVTCADFLTWNSTGLKFSKIVMNPPFSEGRWQAHLTHAATMLAPKGRIVAIVPASAKGKDVLPGFNITWSRVYSNEFSGTSVSVVILVAEVA